MPTFTTKSIQQSSPLNGVLNTLTVTLVTDVDLAATSTVTIAGLTGTQTADAASLAITSTSSLLGTTAGWTKDSGTLVLTVGGTATTAGSDVVVTMVVTNKATAQDAVSPTVTASIEAGTNDCTITSSAMDKPGTDLIGVTGGLDPLKTVVPTFTTKSIQQSSPLVEVYNVITLTLASDVDLSVSSTITIWGLVASQSTDDDAYTLTSDSSVFGSSGSWTQSGGLMLLTVASITTALTEYEVTFTITNPSSAQSSPNVALAATIEAGTIDCPITSSFMVKPDQPLLGVSNAKNPLLVFKPVFTTQSIGQINPLTDSSNELYVTLAPSQDVAAGSDLTISGLTGTQTVNSQSLAVACSPSNLEATGVWTQQSGTLVVTLATMFDKDTSYVISFAVRNSATAQDARIATISGAVEAGTRDSPIEESAITNGLEEKLGVSDGSGTLYAYVPLFTVKNIEQSNILTNAVNVISITLTTNADFAVNSVITIDGLVSTQTVDGAVALSLDGSATSDFTASFVQSSGTLEITVAAEINVNTPYVLSWTLLNSLQSQSSPTISISATVERGTFDSPVTVSDMTKVINTLQAVSSGSAVLYVVHPGWDMEFSEIGQKVPFTSDTNTITVTFTPNVTMPSGSVLTISGLTGTTTGDGQVAFGGDNKDHVGSDSTGYGAWVQSDGSMTFTLEQDFPGGVAYILTWLVGNPAAAQDSPLVQVSGTIVAGTGRTSEMQLEPITKTSGQRYGCGVSGLGPDQNDAIANPLEIVYVNFTTKSLAHVSCLAGADNFLTLELRVQCWTPWREVGCRFPSEHPLSGGAGVTGNGSSSFTVTGLTGTQTASTLNGLQMNQDPADVFEMGIFVQVSGRFELSTLTTLNSPEFTSANIHQFQFVMWNPATEQDAPTVTLQGNLDYQDYVHVIPTVTLESVDETMMERLRPA